MKDEKGYDGFLYWRGKHQSGRRAIKLKGKQVVKQYEYM